ncbi:hypothetical protein [Halomonas sp. DP5N14-9]|uniref:DUF8020 domain-containing protein n=1 Tax=Halomonas sp. RT37 TaxID=2950872 RepID=A0AAU7KDL4_9GAMM|nr:hypothetical protein [Halomonas sp. DP5N14-9]MBY5942771.1 hypothetical protein [Halomonas sp. DP5N14-9]
MITPGASGPAVGHYQITPSDTEALHPLPRALFALTDGQVAIKAAIGDTAITYPVAAGQVYPIRAAYVLETGTTATLAAWW